MLKNVTKNINGRKPSNYNKLYRFSQQELLNVLQEAGWVQEPCGQSAFDKISNLVYVYFLPFVY